MVAKYHPFPYIRPRITSRLISGPRKHLQTNGPDSNYPKLCIAQVYCLFTRPIQLNVDAICIDSPKLQSRWWGKDHQRFHIVRDLGVMLDSNMTMSPHVLRVCQTVISKFG